jgi:hypothetical protein
MNDNDRAGAVRFYDSLERPVLILSSRAGRGNISIAEAIREQFSEPSAVLHRSIEDFLPPAIVNEDLRRYRLLSNHVPLVLAGMYTIPFLYARKLWREKMRRTRLELMEQFLQRNGIKTVVCISHRQAFWAGVLKRNTSARVALYGVLTEFGPSLGWKYILWDQMDGFISPLPANALGDMLPAQVPFWRFALPARSSFSSLPRPSASAGHCLLMGGFWGQGRLKGALDLLVTHFPSLPVHVVCGDNDGLLRRVRHRFGRAGNIAVYGLLDSVEPLLARCSCVVTKPGMGTLLEARASGRKIFLFRGMPVAESHNARYALTHFDAEWLTVAAFSRWRAAAPARA